MERYNIHHAINIRSGYLIELYGTGQRPAFIDSIESAQDEIVTYGFDYWAEIIGDDRSLTKSEFKATMHNFRKMIWEEGQVVDDGDWDCSKFVN